MVISRSIDLYLIGPVILSRPNKFFAHTSQFSYIVPTHKVTSDVIFVHDGKFEVVTYPTETDTHKA